MNLNYFVTIILAILIQNVLKCDFKSFYLSLEIIKNTFKIKLIIEFGIVEKDTRYIKM